MLTPVCWGCQAGLSPERAGREHRTSFARLTRLQARRENGAAEPTRVLRPSRSQQEELSRDHIRASFADIQDSSPSTSTASRSGHDSTHNNTSIDAKQPQRRNHQRQHAAFPDLMISQPYSIVMFAWGCLLVYSGRLMGCWAGMLAAGLWLSCAGAGAMVLLSLAATACLAYNLVSGGNPPTASSAPQETLPHTPATQAPTAAETARPSQSRSREYRSHWWRKDQALLQASSAAVADSIGSKLSPSEASKMERAIAAGLKQQLPTAIQGVFMDPDMNMRFDVTANINTLFALVGVIFFWRGIWTLWDVGLGDSMFSEVGGIGLGLVIMLIIKWRKLPLAEGLPVWDRAVSQRVLAKTGPALSKASLTRVRIRGDGNCLFRALARGHHQLLAGQAGSLEEADERLAAQKLRSCVCRELRSRQADIEPFLDDDFGSYVRRMESDAVWGGEPELAVAPHCLLRPIDVFTQRRMGPLEQISSYGDEYRPAAAVSLFFHQGGHYDLLVPAAPSSKL
ncbi:hypothetical protein WJX84_002419 [Apatococcus fuscideae]|uniref:Ubiquitin thioesterase OTU n=1 Tax=Apatococcus fuscideae TaxID=2026836 RepID=A0AAW1SYU4_9CHLO